MGTRKELIQLFCCSLVARFLAALYETFVKLHFTYLEINPIGKGVK